MIVGRVFSVEVHIRAKLDSIANKYSHHHCMPNKRPGNIIAILVIKAKNSIVFSLFQYELFFIEYKTIDISLIFIIHAVSQIFVVSRALINKLICFGYFISSHFFKWLYVHNIFIKSSSCMFEAQSVFF